MDLNKTLRAKRSNEEALNQQIELALKNADFIKNKHLPLIKHQEDRLKSNITKSGYLKVEVKKLQARIAAIIDLEPSYEIQTIEDDMPLTDNLHQEVYDSKIRLLKIEHEQNELNSRKIKIESNILDQKSSVNEKLNSIDSNIEKLKNELAENLAYQEKLNNVIDPEYNMKSSVVKELEDEGSNTYLIIALVFSALMIPFFGVIALFPLGGIAYKLYKKKTAHSRVNSHKTRV